MNKKAMIYTCIAVVLLVLFIFIPYIDINSVTHFNPGDYCNLTDVDYKAIIRNDGVAEVTEKLTYDVHAAYKNNPYWEIWRGLAEDNLDGLEVDYNVKSVSQIMPDGTKVPYTESSKLYWDDSDYTDAPYGPHKWYHSKGPYNESARRYECVLFYVDGLYREKVQFEVEYEYNNAAFRYADSSELYLAMYGGDECDYLKSFNAQILFKDDEMPKENEFYAYGLGTNSSSFGLEQSPIKNPGYTTFSFSLDKDDLKFRSYNKFIEFILISFGSSKDSFTFNAPKNRYSYEDSLNDLISDVTPYLNIEAKYKPIRLKILIACIASAAIMVLIAKILVNAAKGKHQYYTPTTNYNYFRDIPSDLDPIIAANLVFIKEGKYKNKDDLSALLLDLVRKKYIAIEKINDALDWTPKNTKIKLLFIPTESSIIYEDPLHKFQPVRSSSYYLLTNAYSITSEKRIPPEKPLSVNEAYFFNLLLRHAKQGEIQVKEFQDRLSLDYDRTNMFVTRVKESVKTDGLSKGYFQKVSYADGRDSLLSASNFYLITGTIIGVILNLIFSRTPLYLAYGGPTILGLVLVLTSIFLRKKAGDVILFTQEGADEYAKWRGLYNFLKGDTLINEKESLDVNLWEEYLVYATAFGLSKNVSSALKIRCPEAIKTSSAVLHNSYIHSRSFRTSSRGFHSSTSHASFSSGGFGGYGGGGRGGGGGGGGH